MDETKLKTTAEERERCVNSVCPSVITVRKMADDIETLLAEIAPLRERLGAAEQRIEVLKLLSEQTNEVNLLLRGQVQALELVNVSNCTKLEAERDVLRNDVAHLEMDRDIARSERETLSEALDQEAEHRIAMERSYREQIKITEQQLTDSNAEREQLLKNRDQWERNSAAENKRAGDLEVEVKNLKSERDALAQALNHEVYLNDKRKDEQPTHDAEIRRKALEEAVNVCKQQGSSFAAWGIRSLIDAPKEGRSK